MTLLKAIILGIIQGITEFLPISSSGHLAIFQILFKIEKGNLFFSEMLHFGTLLSIIIVYYKDIYNMIIEFFKIISKAVKKEKIELNRHGYMALYIIIATIPTVIIALILNKYLEYIYTSTILIGLCFVVTAFLILNIDIIKNNKLNIENMKIRSILAIGAIQGIAALPGISRSGSTISASVVLGMKKKDAVDFSFLMSIPAVTGAFILGMKDVLSQNASVKFDFNLFLGIIVSMITGILAIRLIKILAKKRKFYIFSIYLLIIGIISLFL